MLTLHLKWKRNKHVYYFFKFVSFKKKENNTYMAVRRFSKDHKKAVDSQNLLRINIIHIYTHMDIMSLNTDN